MRALSLILPLLAANGAVAATPPGMRGKIVETIGAGGRKHCLLWPRGCRRDDVPNLLTAFKRCNNGGTVVFPDNTTYWIGTRINPVLNNVNIEWRGRWVINPDIDYWYHNVYPIAFQNHSAGIVFTGDHIKINGYDTGHIDGNGDVWYNNDQGNTKPGRPMPFVFWNVSDVDVRNFKVLQPPLWSINIMNGTNMYFENMLANATAHDAPANTIWTGNTDGFDTMDAHNITLKNFVYRGGDDCVAIKPRSYDIKIQNVTCVGGNGIAIGSLGQYLEDSSVENVWIDDVYVIRDLQNLRDSAYIKTWVGVLINQTSYESGGLPRGGGWGRVNNVNFTNFRLHGANHGPQIAMDSGNNGTAEGTSKMEVSNILFANWTGFLAGETRMATFKCSHEHPCHDIRVENMTIKSWSQGEYVNNGTCRDVIPGTIYGVEGC